MSVHFTKLVRSCIEPKLGYHGFKYSDEKSHPPTAHHEFTSMYFGRRQRGATSIVQYDLEDISRLIAESDEIPEEVPAESMLIQEPGYRLWLSTRYIVAVIGHEYSGLEVTRTGLADYAPFAHLADLPADEGDQRLKEL